MISLSTKPKAAIHFRLFHELLQRWLQTEKHVVSSLLLGTPLSLDYIHDFQFLGDTATLLRSMTMEGFYFLYLFNFSSDVMNLKSNCFFYLCSCCSWPHIPLPHNHFTHSKNPDHETSISNPQITDLLDAAHDHTSFDHITTWTTPDHSHVFPDHKTTLLITNPEHGSSTSDLLITDHNSISDDIFPTTVLPHINKSFYQRLPTTQRFILPQKGPNI